MKIAVASDDGITTTGHVGRCEMFLVFDIKDNEIINKEIRPNSFTMHKNGEHQENNHQHFEHIGRHGGIISGLNDCQYLICCGAGPGLISDLKDNGVDVLLIDEMEAEMAVKALISGTLINYPDKSCKEHHH
jgi:predicted Fe-Mo cluster-binding NifX family protein